MLVSVVGTLLMILLLSVTSNSAPAPRNVLSEPLREVLKKFQDDTNVGKNKAFLDQIRSHLSMPVGEEENVVVAAVVKLLGENAKTRELSEIRTKHRASNEKFGNNHDYLSDYTGTEKRKLKFNPTGWRKKRSTDDQGRDNLILARIHDMLEESRNEKTNAHVPKFMLNGLEKKRSIGGRDIALDDIIAHIRTILAKRRAGPLDFNPTGW